MTIVFSGSPVANVQLSDSFNTWRLTTNKILADAASLTSNNTFAAANTNFAGEVRATAFIGDGSNLTNAGSTVASDMSVDRDLFVPFTGIANNTMTSANVNSTFTFNPGAGRLSANVIKTSTLLDSSNRRLTIRDEANTVVWGG
jgi:hypothetical protein